MTGGRRHIACGRELAHAAVVSTLVLLLGREVGGDRSGRVAALRGGRVRPHLGLGGTTEGARGGQAEAGGTGCRTCNCCRYTGRAGGLVIGRRRPLSPTTRYNISLLLPLVVELQLELLPVGGLALVVDEEFCVQLGGAERGWRVVLGEQHLLHLA